MRRKKKKRQRRRSRKSPLEAVNQEFFSLLHLDENSRFGLQILDLDGFTHLFHCKDLNLNLRSGDVVHIF